MLSARRSSWRTNYKITKSVLDFCLSSTSTPDVTSTTWKDNVPGHEEDGATISDSDSAHIKRKQTLAARWNASRSNAYRVMVQSIGLQHHQKHFICGSDDSDVQCELCGPLYMCRRSYYIKHHDQMNYHHCPEIWQVATYIQSWLTSYISIHIAVLYVYTQY